MPAAGPSSPPPELSNGVQLQFPLWDSWSRFNPTSNKGELKTRHLFTVIKFVKSDNRSNTQ